MSSPSSFAAGQSGQIVSDGGEPVDARTALTGVLVGQVACDAGRFGKTAGCLPEHHHHSGAGCGADRAQRDRGIRSPKVLRPDPRPPVPTDQKCVHGLDGLAP